MTTDAEQLLALERQLQDMDGAEMKALPVELLRRLVADARAKQKYDETVKARFPESEEEWR